MTTRDVYGTNPNFLQKYPRIFYETLHSSAGGRQNIPQPVMNPFDRPWQNSRMAWESGLLNPNASADCLAGSNYYTIGLGYGVEPINLYVNRMCGGNIPHNMSNGTGVQADNVYSSGGVYAVSQPGMRPIARDIKPTISNCDLGW
jgi:hypothetical protein